MAEPLEEVSVVALDAHGQGVSANGLIVPSALPGERARVRLEGKRGELVETLEASPERAAPICRWFGRCGAARRSTCRLRSIANGSATW
jgi:23S rRNA (uracil1939-C5)-methyltransferase